LGEDFPHWLQGGGQLEHGAPLVWLW